QSFCPTFTGRRNLGGVTVTLELVVTCSMAALAAVPTMRRMAELRIMVGAGIPLPRRGCPAWGAGNAPVLGAPGLNCVTPLARFLRQLVPANALTNYGARLPRQ